MDIQELINQNIKSRYLLELTYAEDDDVRTEIKKILEKIGKPTSNRLDTFNNKVDELEKLTMKKQFYRLKKQQKINLLIEYFRSQNISDDKLEGFSNDIMELIGNGTLKNKDVEYDMDNIKITNIDKIQILDDEIKIINKTK